MQSPNTVDNTHEHNGNGNGSQKQVNQKSQEGHAHQQHGGDHEGHGDHGSHHARMAEDFKRRFWISLVLTIPILILSPMLQSFFGIKGEINVPYGGYIQFGFSAIVFFYGGWPFIKGLFNELKQMSPGMMTLIAVAIMVAFFLQCSSDLRPEGQGLLLGACHPHRYHAFGPLD